MAVPPPRGYNLRYNAGHLRSLIGVVMHQLRKRIVQAASRVGFRPYLPPKGICVLLERAVVHPGALPMAGVVVLCLVLWLTVGNVSSLRLADVSFPL